MLSAVPPCLAWQALWGGNSGVYCCWMQIMESLDMLLPALLDALNSPSEKVVVEALMVQASIAEDEDRFRQLMQFLLDRSVDLPQAA